MDKKGLNPFWSPGVPSKDKYVPGKCKRRPSNICFEQCLLEEWGKPRPTYSIGPLKDPGDCQEYDDYVNDKCWKKCKGKK